MVGMSASRSPVGEFSHFTLSSRMEKSIFREIVPAWVFFASMIGSILVMYRSRSWRISSKCALERSSLFFGSICIMGHILLVNHLVILQA